MGAGRSRSAAKVATATSFGLLAILGSLVVASPSGAAGPATQIVLTATNTYGNQDPILLSGFPTTLTATIEDTSGNTVTTGPFSTASVTFAKTAGTGTVTGLGSFAAVNGVATDVITGGAVNDDIVDLQASATLSSGLTDSNTIDANYDAFHGIGMSKSCTSATFIGQPYTCKYLISNTQLTAHDTIVVSGLSDEVFASGGNVLSPGSPNAFLSSLYPALLSPTGSASCSGTAPNIQCTLPYGTSLIAGPVSFYSVEPGDFNINPTTHKLPDTATVFWNDLCLDGSGNCTTATTTETAKSSTTVEQFTPSVTTELTPPGPVNAGTPVTDQATLTGASLAAGGTVTYAVYSNATCTTQVAPLGTKTVTDGSVGPSDAWTSVGGLYWFQATYSGDPSNAGPVSSACTSEPLTVIFVPVVTTELTPPGPVNAGTLVTDQATLTGASPTAGGTVAYAVFSNNTCTTQVAPLGTKTVTDGSVGPSDAWTSVGGLYWFQATYSGDSSDVGPVSSACTSEPLTVKFKPSVTTELTPPGPVIAGTPVTDQATLTGASPTAGGTVAYAVFSNSTCTTQVAPLGTKTVTDGSVGPSDAWTSVGGPYWFQATYSGDSSDVGPVSSACTSEPLTVKFKPSVTTQLTPPGPGPVLAGTSVTDQATLTGASPTAGGTITYAVFSNDTCTTQVAPLGTKTVTDGSVGPSDVWTAVGGLYWFQATYSGDPSNAGPVSSACTSEPLTVIFTPSVTTELTPPGPVNAGTPVTDQATLTGASLAAGGTVTYAVYSNATCTTQVAPLGTKTVTDGSVGPSDAWTSVGGLYWFQATYSGDPSNAGPVSSACTSEPLTVIFVPVVTTELTPPGPVNAGTLVTDQATLTGASPTAGGTVAYAVFSNNTCTTQVAPLGTKTVTDGSVGPSDAWTSVGGLYWFQATYSGDSSDVGPVSSACTSEPLTVKFKPSVTTELTPPGPVIAGTPVTDQATLTGASPTAGGTVAYAVFSNSTCTTQVAPLGTKTVTDGSVGPSDAWTSVGGPYWFQATYSGDSSDVGPVSSACTSEPLTVKFKPSVTTQLTPPGPGPVLAGTSVTDQATLTGASPTAGGTITYAVFSNDTCTTQVAPLGTKTVTDGSVGPSDAWTAVGGLYWFQATYSGDPSNAGPVSSACTSEPLTVGKVSTHLIEAASATTVPSGTSVTFTYTETNTGLDPIKNVTVAGSICGPATLVSSSDGNKVFLEPEAVWTFTCMATLTNTGKKTITVIDKATAMGTDNLTGKAAPREKAHVKVTVTIPVCGLAVTVSPNPLVETGQSEVHAVVQVEACPSFAGDKVNIDTSQLATSCATVAFGTLQPGTHPATDSIQVVLDDDGNVTVSLTGFNCAPGSSVIEADLTAAPYLTALTTLIAQPPIVTPTGVVGYPANEVETGDTTASGHSDVYAVFYVETDPVYAETTVEISSAQLAGRCLGGVTWTSNQGTFTGATATATLDDDGNAVFAFSGASCAAGTSTVIADVLAGTHVTYTSTYTIQPPMVTPS